ncbi:hypothetical protein QTP88_009334 [Uroleucon formosanum]
MVAATLSATKNSRFFDGVYGCAPSAIVVLSKTSTEPVEIFRQPINQKFLSFRTIIVVLSVIGTDVWKTVVLRARLKFESITRVGTLPERLNKRSTEREKFSRSTGPVRGTKYSNYDLL